MKADVLKKFKAWLEKNGCEILPPSNDYEEIRFKGKETGVIYKTGKYSGRYASNALVCFLSGKKWNGAPISTGRLQTYVKEKRQLLERDGNLCFYCWKPLGEDITLEHLIPLTSGGQNNLYNMVLAHDKCNHDAGFKPLSVKVKIAVKNRVEFLINTKAKK